MAAVSPFFDTGGNSCSVDGSGERAFCNLGDSSQGGVRAQGMAMLFLLCQREELAGFSWRSDLGYLSRTGGERDFLPGEVQASWEPDLECFLTGDD